MEFTVASEETLSPRQVVAHMLETRAIAMRKRAEALEGLAMGLRDRDANKVAASPSLLKARRARKALES